MSGPTSKATLNPANAPSARFFGGIGIAANMRVLDVGCGNGELSRFIAEIIGPGGEVVAIDHSESALAAARSIPRNTDAGPIVYRQAELTGDLSDLGHFDAIIGRRVLMYLPDAASTLSGLAKLAKPGAIIAFQEHARSNLPAGLNDLPLHRQLYNWIWSTVAAEGGDVRLALRLGDMITASGFTIEEMRSECILLQSGAPSFLPMLAKMMLPRVIERGMATAEEVGLDTLAERLEEERRLAGGTIVWDLALLVSAKRSE